MSNSISQRADTRVSRLLQPPPAGQTTQYIDTKFNQTLVNQTGTALNIVLPAPERGRDDVVTRVVNYGAGSSVLVVTVDAIGNKFTSGTSVTAGQARNFTYIAAIGEWYVDAASTLIE